MLLKSLLSGNTIDKSNEVNEIQFLKALRMVSALFVETTWRPVKLIDCKDEQPKIFHAYLQTLYNSKNESQ